MNYVILNNEDFFKDKINLDEFKEVDINGSDRIDAIFAKITKEILEQQDNINGGGDSILPKQWLLKDRGVSFILCSVDRSILYNSNTELIEKLFGLFSKKYFYIELWNFNEQESYNQLECYLLAYNKNFDYQEVFIQDKSTEKEELFETLLKKIKENLL